MALAVTRVGGNITTVSNTITSDSWTSTSGSLIVAVGHYYNTTGSAANGDVTDSKSNSYTLAGSILGGASAVGVAVYYNNGGTRGASHTVTVDGPGTPSVNIAVIEITGQDGSTPFDSTTFATSSDATSPHDVTAAAAISGNQIAIYACTLDASANNLWTQPTGYTNIINIGDGSGALVSIASYKINETGTPTVGATRTSSDVVGSRVLLATFKEAGAGSSFVARPVVARLQAVNTATNW